MIIENFKRMEKKYLLNESEYKILMNRLNDYIEKDKYYESKICNIYFDTKDNDLIIHSLEKPEYKEKVRLRSYNVPSLDSEVFLEIKKKYKGVVGKRRIAFKLSDYYEYIKGNKPENVNNQIYNEIDYCFKNYDLVPKLFLAYDRLSYYSKENPSLRITFDTNIRSRREDLKLEEGDAGRLYFKDKMYIMEIKTLDSYPFWLIRILNDMHIYPASFSKYGSIYSNEVRKERLLYV